MDLSEFREELGDVLFHKFFDENYKSVRDVVESSKEDLINTIGIEPDKLDEILSMLKKDWKMQRLKMMKRQMNYCRKSIRMTR